MATGIVTMLDGKPALLMPGNTLGDKVLCLVWLPGAYAEGQAVEYTQLWGEWEGEAALIGGQRLPTALAYTGAARTIPEMTEDLNVDEDQLGFQGL